MVTDDEQITCLLAHNSLTLVSNETEINKTQRSKPSLVFDYVRMI